MTGRSVKEWVGATPDTKVPDRVKVRVFEAHKGICYRSNRKILAHDAWQVDHMLALGLGGENRETNLAPVLVEPHKAKTKKDVGMMAKADRMKRKHLGLHKPKGRPMDGTRASGRRKRMDGTVEYR